MAAPIQYLGMDAKDMKYRFNWNAPIIWSQYEPNTYYHGAQVLLKTQDWGKTWTEVSPDLTRNEKEKQGKGGVPYTNEAVGAENYGTIAYVMESPHEKGVIWTGSDDGLVHLTRDGGKTWTNVTPKGLAECLVNAIEVSPHDPATAISPPPDTNSTITPRGSTRPPTTERPGPIAPKAFLTAPLPEWYGKIPRLKTYFSPVPKPAYTSPKTAVQLESLPTQPPAHSDYRSENSP